MKFELTTINTPGGKDKITVMIMIIFDNHKIEWKLQIFLEMTGNFWGKDVRTAKWA